MKRLIFSRSRKAALLVAAIVVALVAGVYAYRMLLSQQQIGPRVTITSPPLEFSMELEKAEFAVGENITIKFYLKNISNQTIRVTKFRMVSVEPSDKILFTEADRASTPAGVEHLLSVLFHFGFSVTDNNGTEVFRSSHGPMPTQYNIVFEPSGYVKQTLIWKPEKETLVSIEPLLDGTYQVRGILYSISLNDAWPPITLETPSIALAIV